MTSSRTALLVGLVAGALLFTIGFAARGYASGSGFAYEEQVPRWVEKADGTVEIYEYADQREGATPLAEPYYDIVIGGEEAAVYLVDDLTDLRYEVFRGAEDEARDTYGAGEADFQLMRETIDESTDVIYRTDELRALRVEVFRGAPEVANAWEAERFTVLAFAGERVAAEEWVRAHPEYRPDLAVPNMIAAVGVVAMIATLAMLWLPTPSRLVYAVIGGAVGLLPGAVLRLLVEASAIAEDTTDMGATSLAIGFGGLAIGAAIGAGLGERARHIEPRHLTRPPDTRWPPPAPVGSV